MKAKTISKVISQKMNEWLASVDDPKVADALQKEVIVTGGCITSMLLQERVNDYDVYFRTPVAAYYACVYYIGKMIDSGNFKILPMIRIHYPESVETYRVKGEFGGTSNSGDDAQLNQKFKLLDHEKVRLQEIERVEVYVKSQGFSAEGNDSDYKYFESESPEDTCSFFEGIAKDKINEHLDNSEQAEGYEKYRPVFISSNAISLSDSVQLVLRFTGDPDKIHESYDFSHATNYWTESDGLVTNTDALECILAKELRYMGSLYPLASIFRTRKFIQRGWGCHIGNYLKMAMQLNDYDLTNVETLRDQLTGVDAAYLHEIIKAVETKKKSEPDFKFTSTYICEIIERMMG